MLKVYVSEFHDTPAISLEVTVILVKLVLLFSEQCKSLNFVRWLAVVFWWGRTPLTSKQICEWLSNFKHNHMDIDDVEHSGRPKSSVAREKIKNPTGSFGRPKNEVAWNSWHIKNIQRPRIGCLIHEKDLFEVGAAFSYFWHATVDKTWNSFYTPGNNRQKSYKANKNIFKRINIGKIAN